MPNDGVHGEELWVSDGTEIGTRLVKDVAPGEDWSVDTSPDIAEFQGRCIAIMDDGTSGDQLWVSDGTGDAQMLSSNLGTNSGMVWGDGDFNGDGDVDVWTSDGSAVGLRRGRPIRMSSSSRPEGVDPKLVFVR